MYVSDTHKTSHMCGDKMLEKLTVDKKSIAFGDVEKSFPALLVSSLKKVGAYPAEV